MALTIQESSHSHSYWCVCAPGKQRQTDKMIDGERKETSVQATPINHNYQSLLMLGGCIQCTLPVGTHS